MYDIFKPESIRNYLKELYDEKQKLNKEFELLAVSLKVTDEEIEKVEILLEEAETENN